MSTPLRIQITDDGRAQIAAAAAWWAETTCTTASLMTPFKFLPFGTPVEAKVQACERGAAERIRLDRDREASHDLNRLLDEPGP